MQQRMSKMMMKHFFHNDETPNMEVERSKRKRRLEISESNGR